MEAEIDQTMRQMLKRVGSFGGGYWSVEKKHNRDAAWLKDLKHERNSKHYQNTVRINAANVSRQYRKIPNWKAPGRDGFQGYLIKNQTSLHIRIDCQLNKILELEDDLPTLMTYAHTVMCQKVPAKGNVMEAIALLPVSL